MRACLHVRYVFLNDLIDLHKNLHANLGQSSEGFRLVRLFEGQGYLQTECFFII